MKATTIDEVITELENILENCTTNDNRAGYFAALYHKVTVRVKEGIINGEFEDGKRMEQLDVVFANRYLEAYNQYKNNKETTHSWATAFNAASKRRNLVIQHLLLGINAHINLDLGIAAVEVAKEQSLDTIQKDFIAINTIIASLTYEVMNDIARVSPLLSLMGFHATNYNSILIQFSISNARDGAWRFAEELSSKTGSDYQNCIAERDKTINLLAEGLISAKGILRFTIWLIHLFEWKNPSKIITVLRMYVKKRFSVKKEKNVVIAEPAI